MESIKVQNGSNHLTTSHHTISSYPNQSYLPPGAIFSTAFGYGSIDQPFHGSTSHTSDVVPTGERHSNKQLLLRLVFKDAMTKLRWLLQ
jgi:hypothetical protein